VATLLANEVAEPNRRFGETLSVAIDRLRYWTNIGAIKAIGKAQGSGYRRRYPRIAVLEMAYLNALTDIGLDAKHATFTLHDPQHLAPFLLPDMKPTDRTLLVVSRATHEFAREVRMYSPQEFAERITSEREIFESYDNYGVIDAEKIRRRLAAVVWGEGK
jgi:hypothetical protein